MGKDLGTDLLYNIFILLFILDHNRNRLNTEQDLLTFVLNISNIFLASTIEGPRHEWFLFSFKIYV